MIKKRWKKKKIKSNKKELKDLLWDIAVCFKLSYLKSSSQQYV